MRIDFVSDIACPWCAVGLNSLEMALSKLDGAFPVELHFQPFELHPDMQPAGVEGGAFIRKKYNMSEQQLAESRQHLYERGSSVGFNFGGEHRIWNTFDAHRLLYWAGTQSAAAQRALKHELLTLYHSQGGNPGEFAILVELAAKVGLDAEQAKQVLDNGQYGEEVRAAEKSWQQAGIQSVPAIVINGRHLISGGQPPEVFEQALRKFSHEPDDATPENAVPAV